MFEVPVFVDRVPFCVYSVPFCVYSVPIFVFKVPPFCVYRIPTFVFKVQCLWTVYHFVCTVYQSNADSSVVREDTRVILTIFCWYLLTEAGGGDWRLGLIIKKNQLEETNEGFQAMEG
jgi:hypothetical protein